MKKTFWERIGEFFNELGRFIVFMTEALKHFPKNIRHPREIFKNIWNIGVKSIPIIFFTGFFTGMILALQTAEALESIIAGTSQFVGAALSAANFRELGPVLTGLIVVSRVCSSITAHIGTMKVTEQIDALHTLSVNPVSFLVTPRILAGMISLPILGLINTAAALVGGWLVLGSAYNIDTYTFWTWAQTPLRTTFVVESIVKMIFIGATLMLVATYHGFNTKGGAAGVGESTIKSVVVSSFLVILLDYIIGAFFLLFTSY